MLLTDADLDLVRQSIEGSAGWDQELLQRTSSLVHVGAFDEAVRNALVLLEDRLRKAANKEGANMTGTQLADFAFSPDKGPLAKHYGHNHSEREGLHALYTAAFKLFRNPTAHRVVNFDPTEAKFIIGYVNLLLYMLDRIKALQPDTTFPDNLEQALQAFEKTSDAATTNRLRIFLSKCVKLGVNPRSTTKQWVPFRRYALVQYPHWEKPKPHAITVFYLFTEANEQGFWFPVNQYYSLVVDFDTKRIAQELRSLGFHPTGKSQDYSLRLKNHASQQFFDSLLDIVQRTAQAFEATL
jgi:uncharacterized protein (TIGR02391 family)